MDSQMCTVEIESFGYTMADLKYAWNDGEKSVKMSPDVALPQFLVLGHRQRLIEVSLSSGNYSRLLADVQFTRSMGYYMIQVYFSKGFSLTICNPTTTTKWYEWTNQPCQQVLAHSITADDIMLNFGTISVL